MSINRQNNQLQQWVQSPQFLSLRQYLNQLNISDSEIYQGAQYTLQNISDINDFNVFLKRFLYLLVQYGKISTENSNDLLTRLSQTVADQDISQDISILMQQLKNDFANILKQSPFFQPESLFYDEKQVLFEDNKRKISQIIHPTIKIPLQKIQINAGASTEEEKEYFFSEAEIIASLDHPTVPTVYEYATDLYDNPYVLLENIEGVSFEDLLLHKKKENKRHIKNNIQILIQVLQSLSYMHQKGVVHRNIQPKNIIVDDFGQVKIIGWNQSDYIKRGESSKSIRTQVEGLTLVQFKSMKVNEEFNPSYTDPALLFDKSLNDPQNDLFSVVAMLFTALTRRGIVDGLDKNSGFAGFINTVQGAGVYLNQHTPAEINAIFLDALCSSSSVYKTPLDLARDLQNYLDGQPVSVYTVPMAEKRKKWLKENAIFLYFIVGVLVLISVGVAFSVLQKSFRYKQRLLEDEKKLLEKETEELKKLNQQTTKKISQSQYEQKQFFRGLELLEKAEEYSAKGREEKKQEYFDRIFREIELPSLLLEVANIYLEEGKKEKALPFINKVLKKDPENWSAKNMKTRVQ